MIAADLEQREQRWGATNNPAVLWPGLDLATITDAAHAIERAVSRVLGGRIASLGRTDGGDAAAMGIAALISGTGPLLGYWVQSGLLDVSDSLASILEQHLTHGRNRADRIRSEFMPALSSVLGCGVTPVILKGFHTAHVYYPEPGLRPLADVDIFVEPEHAALAARALERASFTSGGQGGRYKFNWYPPGPPQRIHSLDLWHTQNPWRIELHHALEFGTLIRHGVHLERWTPLTEQWDGLGVPARVLTQPLLFVAIAAHVSCELYAARLLRIIELTWIIRRDSASGMLDWLMVRELLERTGASRFVYPALTLVEQLAPGTVNLEVLARTRRTATPISRKVVAQLTPATPILQERTSFAERLMWEPGLAGIVRRVLEMFLPGSVASPMDALRIYRSRLSRIFTGRVSWRLSHATSAHESEAS